MAPGAWLILPGATAWRAGAAALLVLLGATIIIWLSRRKEAPTYDWIGHIEDLRRRLMVCAAALLVATAFMFSFRWPAGSWYPTPAVQDNLAAQAFQHIVADLVPEGVTLVVVRPMDGFIAEMVIALGLGAVVAAPVLLWQLGGFFWPALKDNERKVLRNAFLPVLLLFFAGGAFAYVYVLPFLLRTLYGYGDALGAQALLQVSELMSFTVGMVLIMGIAFQTPLVMYALTRTGIVAARTWRRTWRHAVVLILIVSAIITDPTVVSQVLVALPLMGLYGLGLVLTSLATPASR